MKEKIKHSIKWKMLAIVLICWLLPFLLLLGVMGYYFLTNQADNQARQITDQLVLNNQICGERLDGAIAASRQASYDRVFHNQYQSLSKNIKNYNGFYAKVQPYLAEQYGRNKAFTTAMLWLADDPANRYCAAYNERNGGGFQQINTYWEEDHEEVAAYAGTLDTSIGFLNRDGRIYMLRNLVDNAYKPWGVLVMRLNTDYCFETLTNFLEEPSVRVELDDNRMFLRGDAEVFERMESVQDVGKGGYRMGKDYLYAYHTLKKDDYCLSTVVAEHRDNMLSPFYGYRYVIIGMVLFLVPILLLLLNMFRRHIAEPIQVMMQGAREIEKGELGHQLDYDAKSLEFQYLTESFDQMSKQLKYQFDHIYEEELALRDAKIMALQSHINPHFMNNTLEIINWESRLSGDIKVSKMIEALSILMDAAIDRKKRPEVPLSEEMRYVDAYLYITSERLGKRLRVEKEIQEGVLDYPVPRLILQPVIENAIEHGVIPNGSGTVRIHVHEEDGCLCLDIENDGTLTEKDQKKIEEMLSPDYDICKAPCASMGIANVNQRLRVLYGERCGLQIKKKDENHVLARLTIHVQQNEQ